MIFPLLLVAAPTPAPGPVLEALAIEPQPQALAVAALGADGGNRLVGLTGRQLRLVEEPDMRLRLPDGSLLWTVADLDEDGRDEILLLIEGRELRRVERGEDGLRLGEPLLEGLGALIPRGLHSAAFVRDLDGDGRNDLLLPLGSRVRVLLGTPLGFRPGPDLGAVASLNFGAGGGRNLLDRVERDYRVPSLVPEDVTGDGRLDLVVSEGLQIRQFVATGSGLPETPTRTLDLDPYRLDPGALRVDVTNLAKLTRALVVEEWEDLNGDGAQDLVVLGDGKVRTFLGGPEGVDASGAARTLKIDGNPLYVACARLDDDEHADLVVVRIEDIGVTKLLRAALFSWSLDFDFIVFRGAGNGGFAARPLYTRKVTVQGERLLSVAGEQRDRLADLRRTIVRRGDLDGDGAATDVVVLEPDGRLRAWRGVAAGEFPGSQAREQFLRETLGSESRELAFNLDELAEWVLGRTSALLALTRSRPPDAEAALPGGWSAPHALAVRDLDGDGRDEAIALRRVKVGDEPALLTGFRVAF
jgi:hypothetical protein